jgi:hypothetical protein
MVRISRRKRAAEERIKKGTILRAKRSDCMRVLGGVEQSDRAVTYRQSHGGMRNERAS